MRGAARYGFESYDPAKVMQDLIGSPVTEADEDQAAAYFRGKLAKADYLVLTDNNLTRLRGLTHLLPVILGLHDDLMAGRGGFKQVASFGAQWRVLGLRIDDGGAEPSFRLLDHPRTFIFQRSAGAAPAQKATGGGG